MDHCLKHSWFLSRDDVDWTPSPDTNLDVSEQDLKKSARAQTFAVSTTDPVDRLLEQYGRWMDLLRVVAHLLRYRQFLRFRIGKAKVPTKGNLTVKELQKATIQMVKLVQQREFAKEYQSLLRHNPVALYTDLKVSEARQLNSQDIRNLKRNANGQGSSPWRRLNPIMIDDVIRVGGRLREAPVEFGLKHPMILPSRHHITNLVIRYFHEGTPHCPGGQMGMNYVLAQIREEFWILQAQRAIRRVITRCVQCRRWNERPSHQLMASLPEARVTPSNPPFTFTKVDYFGLFLVKCHKQRSHAKRYGCLFSCMTTRAVHIEVAPSLDSDSFIEAFTRLTSRGGPPRELYSDNGTNFRGAEAEIKGMLALCNQKKIADILQKHGTGWHFNPPAASHHGGAWERMIRSLVQQQLVEDYTLMTLIAEVEKILNDRPLVHLADDPESQEALTPSSLLLLRSNPCYPPGEFNRDDLYTRRWRQAHYLADLFWKRWKEYIPTLQERNKWQRPRRNLQVDDLVLMCDGNAPRGQWPMAIVEEVYPERRRIVRQAMVRTNKSCFRRDIRNLCLLEGAENRKAAQDLDTEG